jgi:hypothetical protein
VLAVSVSRLGVATLALWRSIRALSTVATTVAIARAAATSWSIVGLWANAAWVRRSLDATLGAGRNA